MSASLVSIRGGFTEGGGTSSSLIPSLLADLLSAFRARFSRLNGLQADTAILLATVTVAATASKLVNVAPIIGLIAAGAILGPRGRNLFSMPQTIEALGNMGILLFLFEIGMGLNFDRFVCLQHDIFGLGLWQLVFTTWAGYGVSRMVGLPSRSSVAVALAMAMSSTAFVLQILTNKNEMNSPIGRASFGMLLLQDIAILPVLLLFDFMTKGGSIATQVVGNLKNLLAAGAGLAVIYAASSIVFGPMFPLLNRSDLDTKVPTSLALVLIASLWTQLCGLSESLGAFLGGIFLSGTRHEHDIAQALAPMRTLLMGLFFLHVGFDIDMFVIYESPRVFGVLLLSLYLIKTAIIAVLSRVGGLTFRDSIRCGLLNAQAGEFALVVLEAAHRLGIIDGPTRRFCLTLAAVSMAATPMVDSLAARTLGLTSSTAATAAVTSATTDVADSSTLKFVGSPDVGVTIKARATRLKNVDHGM